LKVTSSAAHLREGKVNGFEFQAENTIDVPEPESR
jgi:hypothetical protein